MTEKRPGTQNAWVMRFTAITGITACLGIALVPHVVAYDYGGVLPSTRYWACVVIGALGVLAIPSIIFHRRVRSLESLGLPIIALVVWCIALLQTLPIGLSAVSWFSPGCGAVYRDWVPTEIQQWAARHPVVDDFAGADAALRGGQTDPEVVATVSASVCVWLTRQAMAMPALLGCVAFLSVFALRGRRTLLLWMTITALAGGVFAFVSLMDTVRATAPMFEGQPSGKLITPAVFQAAPFGSFVNKNNAAYYLNLCLGCTLGLLVYSHVSRRGETSIDEKYVLPVQHWWDRPRLVFEQIVRDADARTIGLMSLAVLQFVAILASNSRGGFLASVAGVAVCLVAGRKKSARAWAVLPLLAALIASVLLLDHLNLSERARDRVESIVAVDNGDGTGGGWSRDGRLLHWQDSLQAAMAYFPAGAGLGAYQFAYLPFQDASGGGWFVHADGMPLECLVEGGVWLVLCVSIAVVLLVRALGRLKLIGNAPHLNGLRITGWFLIGSTCVSQCFDFGILVLANYLILAGTVGAVFGATARPYRRRGPRRDLEPHESERKTGMLSLSDAGRDRLRRVAVLAIAVALIGVWLDTIRMTGLDAVSDHEIRSLIPAKRVDGEFESWRPFAEGDVLDYRELRELLNRCGDNPFVKLTVAESLVTRQLPLAYDRAVVAQLPEVMTAKELQQLRVLANVEMRRAVFYDQSQDGRVSVSPDEVLLPGQSIAELRLAHLLASEALLECPMSLRARGVLLITDFVRGDPHIGLSQSLIEQTVASWPNSPELISWVARVALAFPGYESASPIFHRLLELQPSQLNSQWQLMLTAPSEPALMQSMPDDPQLLLNAIDSVELPGTLRERLIGRARTLLSADRVSSDRADEGVTGPTNSPWPEPEREFLRGRLALLDGDRLAAEASFGAAVRLNPSLPNYRLFYADALEANGKISEAIEQIKRCQLQSPKDARFADRLKQLMQRREVHDRAE